MEEQYRLCGNCNKHVKLVLREKKKMVLGLKFLDFVMKGTAINANRLQRTMGNVLWPLKNVYRYRWKQRIRFSIMLLAIINVLLTSSKLPTLTREHITGILGELIGGHLFIYICHVMAFGSALNSCLNVLVNNLLEWKIFLFVKTILIMLLFTFGIRLPEVTWNNLFLDYLCPFIMLAFSFLHNAMDGFRFGCHTFLLAAWSVYAGHYYNNSIIFIDGHLIKVNISIIIVVFCCLLPILDLIEILF